MSQTTAFLKIGSSSFCYST